MATIQDIPPTAIYASLSNLSLIWVLFVPTISVTPVTRN